MARPNIDQVHLRRLRDAYAQLGCMPTYSQMAKALGFKAKNAAFKLTERLIESGYLTKTDGGRVVPAPTFFMLAESDDHVRAGFGAMDAATGVFYSQALSNLVVKQPSRTVLLPVRGDSMVNAGILSGDVAVVELRQAAVHGDIVVAEMDGSYTIKEFRLNKGRSCLASHGSEEMIVQPKSTLNIIGVVTGVVRSYGLPKVGKTNLPKQGASHDNYQ